MLTATGALGRPSAPSFSAKVSSGGAEYLSPTAGPATARNSRSASRTVRVSANSTAAPNAGSPVSGPHGTRPRLGFNPTSPHADAGIRIDPAASFACAIGTAPAATSAAAPPLDPPTPRSSAHGLLVGPVRTGSVAKLNASSGTVVTPNAANPAARKRRIRSESCRARIPLSAREPKAELDALGHGAVLEQERRAAERPVRVVRERRVEQRLRQPVHHRVRPR